VTGDLREAGRQLDAITAVLGPALATWATRDEAQAQPGVRQAANTAMAAIDDMLASLHRVRGQLVTEMRRFDDASLARADELLARYREAGR
jgi:flagellin-like hook-associated protein FlgL